MPERQPTGNSDNEAPPPYYAGDKGWNKERQKRHDEIFQVMLQDDFAKREHDKGTLDALRTLIEETEAAVQKNPDIPAGDIWTNYSRLGQNLHCMWYLATKDRI
jgi:hypothetical protein